MKISDLFALLLSLVAFCITSCGQSDDDKKSFADEWTTKKDSIKVGMTYDEVERLLGKPSQIGRGSNSLEMETSSSYDKNLAGMERRLRELKFAQALAETSTTADVWPFPPVVKTVGQLIYVNWVYSHSAVDTCYGWVYNETTKTETYKVPVEYLVNNVPVEKATFEHIKDGQTVYFMFQRRYICSKDQWETQRRTYGDLIPQPEFAKKEIRYADKVKNTIVAAEPTKILYTVTKYFCVLFDASSGRVVKSSYEPFNVQAVLSGR